MMFCFCRTTFGRNTLRVRAKFLNFLEDLLNVCHQSSGQVCVVQEHLCVACREDHYLTDASKTCFTTLHSRVWK